MRLSLKEFKYNVYQFIRMQNKVIHPSLQQQTLRHKILPLFSTKVQIHKLPLCSIQIVLQVLMFIQMLKFPIDYFSISWFGYYRPVFSLLDFSYFQRYLNNNGFQIVFICVCVLISIYWMTLVALFFANFKYKDSSANFRRFMLIVLSTFFLQPIMNTILNLFNCTNPTFFRVCLTPFDPVLIGLSIFTFSVFVLMITIQTFLRFEFVQEDKIYKRIKNSSYMSVCLIFYTIINQLTFYYLSDMIKLIILDISIILLLLVFLIKDEHYQQTTKSIELNMIIINITPILMINIVYFIQIQINFAILIIIWPICIFITQRIDFHTLQFQLENVNKWNTPSMMLSYSETLRRILKRQDQHFFKIQLHGYIEIHRQKCDDPLCPFRTQIIKGNSVFNNNESHFNKSDEVLRTQGIIKSIFNDGCLLSPINAQLQLEYAHFLYQIDQKQASLKHLLMLRYEDLAFDKFYKYASLKNKIHHEMCQKPERQFLDLVSQLQVKKKEDDIIKNFQQVALINLEFWSVLNQDHPDFQKLNQIGNSRVQLGQKVHQSYKQICQFAHSQKITNLYVHFITSIQNDEEMLNKVYEQVKNKYNLVQKIVLQDWSNSSLATLLISIETANYGTIIDLNSTCASLFGYQKHQVVNRPFKTIFTQDLQQQIKQFLNPKIREQIFFISHKNSYLLKIVRKAQTFNSMQTGMTSICTLNNIMSLKSCFIVFNKQQKALGLSSSCISILGIDSKIFESTLYLKDILNFTLEDIKKISNNGNQSFPIQQVLKLQSQSFGSEYRRDSYALSYHSYLDGLFWIQFEVSKITKTKTKRISSLINKFRFQVQTTLTNFKYLGLSQGDQHPFLSQFSQIKFSETIKNQFITQDFGQDITILRLKQNIIQVIEENDDQLVQLNQRKQSQAHNQNVEFLARKDQMLIFQTKQTFIKFFYDYKITKSIKLILLIGMTITIISYVVYYFWFKGHNHNTIGYFSEIAYQNLIIGTIAKQYALITTLQLMKAKVSNRIPSSYYAVNMGNINYLQSVKLLGSSPYILKTYISANETRNMYSDQFLLSFINYEIALAANMSTAITQPQLVAAYAAVDIFKVNYLKLNGLYTRDLMYDRLQLRVQQILTQITYSIYVQLIMLITAVLFLVILGAILARMISLINNEKIRALSVFLGVNEIQINKFTSKTEKFLTSLHLQDNSGQIQMDDQNDEKKINSLTFEKKKIFKMVKLNKSIYLKVLLIPLLAQAFFIESFIKSYISLHFMHESVPYVVLTSQADYNFYKGIGIIQTAVLTHGTTQIGLTNVFLEYYREYFNSHYITFGLIDQFHQAFTAVFMENICNGSIIIAGACNISALSMNGTLLIFTDITVRTQKSDFSIDFTNDYYVGYSVISAAHKYLSMLVLTQQTKLINQFQTSLLNSLIIWIFVVMGVTLIYGLFVLNNFIREVNETKNMIVLLPISIARQLPDVKKYINMIIGESKNI